MSFMNIIGHEKTFQYLDRLVESNKIPHAMIFTGPQGIGKKLVAKFFVQKLFCLEKEKPCEKCSSCLKLEKLEHPDLFWIEPESDHIKIELIRNLKKSLSLAPFESSYKVAVLVDAHHLNLAASNALLKTLEEPPPNTLIILISSLPHFFLKTILSRCQKVYFSPLNSSETEEVLKLHGKKYFFDSKLIEAVEGSPGLALSFSEEVYEQVEKEILPSLESSPKDLLKLLEVAENIASEEEMHEPLLNLLAIRWKEKVLLGHHSNDLKKFDQIFETRRLLQRNVNPLLAFENLFIQLCL